MKGSLLISNLFVLSPFEDTEFIPRILDKHGADIGSRPTVATEALLDGREGVMFSRLLKGLAVTASTEALLLVSERILGLNQPRIKVKTSQQFPSNNKILIVKCDHKTT